MFKKIKVTALLSTFVLTSIVGCGSEANDQSVQGKPNKTATVQSDTPIKGNIGDEGIKAKLALLGVTVKNILPTSLPNLVAAVTDKGILYVSQDGKYLIEGNLYNIDNGIVDESNKILSTVRKKGLSEFNDSFIEYTAKDEKYVINVFTDITCGYCRKLHNEMQAYNDLGITIRYLAFPRGGIASQSYNDMVSIWCADDQIKAMDEGKLTGSVTAKNCENPVKAQYQFGSSMGVSGTPAIILKDGTLVPGYRPPADMLKLLQGA